MAGIGQSDLPGVHAGLAAQPLVSPADPNTVSSDAVQRLVDSFRNGVVSMDDVISRVGDVAVAKKRAVLQELGEYVKPESIQARAHLVSAANQQSVLAGQQAQAGQTLLPAQTNLAQTQIGMEQGNLDQAGGVTAYKQLAAIYNLPGSITGADGKPDYQEMGRVGNLMYADRVNAIYGMPDPSKRSIKTKDATGEYEQFFNSQGFLIDKNLIQRANAARHSLAPQIEDARLRHGAVQSPPRDMPASGMILEPNGSPLITAPASTDVVTPQSSPAPRQGLADLDVSDGGKVKIGPGTEEYAPAQVREMLNADQAYKTWSANKPAIDAFHNEADTAKHSKNVQERLEAERGLVYTISELQQNQANGTIPRGVITDWEKIVVHQPLTGQVKNIIGKVTGNTPLAEDQVNALIKLGQDVIRGKATGALGALESAQQMNPKALWPDEKRLVETSGKSELDGERSRRLRPSSQPGTSSTYQHPTRGTEPSAVGPEIDIPGKGKVQLWSDGTYRGAATP